VNRAHLETQTEDGQTKVRNALSDLEAAGYLVRNRYKAEDGQFAWEAVVYDTPQAVQITGSVSGVPIEDALAYAASKSAGQTIGGSTTDGSPTDGKTTGGESTVLVSTEVVTTEVPITEEQNTHTSPVGDALFEAPVTAPSKAKTKNEYTEEFEAAWKVYPLIKGKLRASKNFEARRKEGVTAEVLTRAAANYARACKKRGTDKMYIKHAEGFWGRDRIFEDWLEDDGGKVNLPSNTFSRSDRTTTETGVVSRDDVKKTWEDVDTQDREGESRALTREEIRAMMKGNNGDS
jgi:hypothetical protein